MRLPAAGISIDDITARLVEDGVRLFADAADQLYAAVQKKRRTVLGSKLNSMSCKLPKELDDAVKAALEDWRKEGKVRRLWAGDASLWTETDEANWLGWLTVVDQQLKAVDHLDAFAADVKRGGFSDALLLGMGGSSLCAEVLARKFRQQAGFPRLRIVDSTDPAQIRRIEGSVDLRAHAVHRVEQIRQHARTQHLEAIFLRPRARGGLGEAAASQHFVAITDPGSSLEKIARVEQFRAVCHGVPSIGGRYSVLSDFGMVPAAAIGIDTSTFLERTAEMVRSCAASAPPVGKPRRAARRDPRRRGQSRAATS